MLADVMDEAVDEWETSGLNQGPWKHVLDFHLGLGEQRGWLVGVVSELPGKSSAELAQFNADLASGRVKSPAQKKGGCFVATAVYGSYDCPEVLVLRRYRDQVLVRSIVGRCFIRTYYAISPHAVRWLGPSFHRPMRRYLDSLVVVLRERGFHDAPYFDRDPEACRQFIRTWSTRGTGTAP
jgi:hypothetical protein